MFFDILSPASDWFEFRLVLNSDPCQWTSLSMRVENVFHASEPELFMQVGHFVHTSETACACKCTSLSMQVDRVVHVSGPCRLRPYEWNRLSMRVEQVVHASGTGCPCEWKRVIHASGPDRPCEWNRLSM